MSKQDIGNEKDALLINQDVQSVVQKMVDQGVYLITPRLDTKGLSYPALSSVFTNKSEAEIQEFLEKLKNAGILKSKLLDKVIVCPTCGSPSVYSKYNCPRCSSFDIGKASIIEHIRCGFIGSKEKFQKGNTLVCPKCKNSVSEVDYRKIGTSFECNSCGSRFEAPRMSHKCNSCDDVFTYKEARYEPIYEFELSEDTKRSVAKGTLPLASILGTLKEAGFDVGLKRDLIGKSGATHNFDIVAKKDSALVVANFTFEPKEEDIIGLFAKKYDVDPTFTLLIALTPPSKEEEAVSRAYGVMILSSTGTRSIGEQIIDLVNEHLRGKEAVPPESSQEELELKQVAPEANSSVREPLARVEPIKKAVPERLPEPEKVEPPNPLESRFDLEPPKSTDTMQPKFGMETREKEMKEEAPKPEKVEMVKEEQAEEVEPPKKRRDDKKKTIEFTFADDDAEQYDF
ncbi:MAG: hypothetical protein OK457_02755 [Thaumarchaeota archaeon]|nr:hypothetical protein [Nitrososphaerota archaeon]